MSAVIAAVVVAGAAAYSGYEKMKNAKKMQKWQMSEAQRKEEYEKEQVQAQQRSPLAMSSPIVAKFGLGVFQKAFAKQGIDFPMEDVVKAMGLDRIIANNAAGKQWDEGSPFQQADAAKDAVDEEQRRNDMMARQVAREDYGLGGAFRGGEQNNQVAVTPDASGQAQTEGAPEPPSYLASMAGAYNAGDQENLGYVPTQEQPAGESNTAASMAGV